MSDELIIVGGGEHARVVIETARHQEWNVIGFVDPLPCEETSKRLNCPRIGTHDDISKYPKVKLVLGVGCVSVNDIRRGIVQKIGASSDRWITLIDSFSCISPTAKLAEGIVVLPGAVISSGASIGRHCIINLGAKINHDVRVGEFVHVSPQAALGGGSSVGDNAYIGMGAMIRDHAVVNDRTLVGMGAVVSKQFPAGSTLIGNPAKPSHQQ